MREMIYDTLKLSKALRVSFTPEQSDTLATAFSESTEDNVATKLDVAGLKIEIVDLRTELKTEIADLRTELKTELAELRTELKTKIADLRTELKTEMAELRTELRTDIANLRVDMVRWIAGAIAFNLLGTIGIMATVAELVLKAK